MRAPESPTESIFIASPAEPRAVRLRPDAALLVFTADNSAPDLALQQRVWALAAWLEARRDALALTEIVPGMGNLLFTLNPSAAEAGPARDASVAADPPRDTSRDPDRLTTLIQQILALWPTLAGTVISGRAIDIPVVYGADRGPDLQDVSAHTGLSIEDIIARHSAAEYRVYCLGFQPGFAYLGGLDSALSTPRRATPRPAIPSGSVAIGGSQSAVYPSATPGGWQIIGRTEMTMFDPARDEPSVLRPGDCVRFRSVEALPVRDSSAKSGEDAAPVPTRGDIEVVRCGALTTVQDLGRRGFRHLGVSQSGALDPIALRQANLLLGNASNAAVLEISVGPLVLRFHRDCHIVLSGSAFVASTEPGGFALQPGHVCAIAAGDTVTLSKPLVPGARTYLAVAGGIEVPPIMGSRSTDINAGFGGFAGRPLQAGDQLTLGSSPADTPPLTTVPSTKGIRPLAPSYILRALPGPDHEHFTADSRDRFWAQPWRINHQSNRMGLRLNGHALALTRPLELLSAGVLPGDVQVPPSGLPIVLSNDAQTIGGYPRIACVIEADLWQLAHVPPGTSVNFLQVDEAEAIAAMARQRRYLHRIAEAFYPLVCPAPIV